MNMRMSNWNRLKYNLRLRFKREYENRCENYELWKKQDLLEEASRLHRRYGNPREPLQ